MSFISAFTPPRYARLPASAVPLLVTQGRRPLDFAKGHYDLNDPLSATAADSDGSGETPMPAIPCIVRGAGAAAPPLGALCAVREEKSAGAVLKTSSMTSAASMTNNTAGGAARGERGGEGGGGKVTFAEDDDANPAVVSAESMAAVGRTPPTSMTTVSMVLDVAPTNGEEAANAACAQMTGDDSANSMTFEPVPNLLRTESRNASFPVLVQDACLALASRCWSGDPKARPSADDTLLELQVGTTSFRID
jgi:hypothetical protein